MRLTLALAGVEFEDIVSGHFAEFKAGDNVLPWGHFPLLLVDGGKANGGTNLSNSVALQWFVAAEEGTKVFN